MPSNEIYLINGIKGLRKIRKPFLILWIDIKINPNHSLVTMIWFGL